MSEDRNKVGPAIKQRPREQLIDYVRGLIKDALYPLTPEERNSVLRSLVPNQVTINRNGSDAEVEVKSLGPGHIEIMISKAIREQTGKVIAGQINDPNSSVSRALQKNVGTERRRI